MHSYGRDGFLDISRDWIGPAAEVGPAARIGPAVNVQRAARLATAFHLSSIGPFLI